MKTEDNKEILTGLLKDRISVTRDYVSKELERLTALEEKLYSEFRSSRSMDRELVGESLEQTRKRKQEMESLSRTPFFAKVVYFAHDEKENKEVYIAKYSFTEMGISSWVAPVASLRFEDLTTTQFKLRDGTKKKVDLNEKNSYVITEEKLVYYSQENKEGVSIIYEDFFSNAKTEFGLSEIISKIQKEQHQIIQSDPGTHLIISGPAGSGKTTICLHRVAYLMQSPETEQQYAGHKMIMFVQDASTRDYFASLLPKLGIERMDIVTFFEWGAQLLGLSGVSEMDTLSADSTYLEYLVAKTSIIPSLQGKAYKSGNFLAQLEVLYKESLKEKDFRFFKENMKVATYDYIDITVMLSMLFDEDGLYRKEKYNKLNKNDEVTSATRKTKVEYSMMIVDEFQNYTQDQIGLMKLCINPATNSLTYIGDMNQKTAYKPISESHDPHYFDECNKITLEKVHRNTKEILSYIKNAGYDISVPDEARSGEKVGEFVVKDSADLGGVLQAEIALLDQKLTLGVLCDSLRMKKLLEEELKALGIQARVMTKQESQGTEFNTAIVVNGDFYAEKTEDSLFEEMKKSVQKNNDYVGYTRAVEKLIVIRIQTN